MQHEDFRINASVRTLLIRLWVDTTQLDHGTVNGIVYLRGSLRREMLREGKEGSDVESVRLLGQRLERQIRNISGVRDVVVNLDNVTRRRGQWVARTVNS